MVPHLPSDRTKGIGGAKENAEGPLQADTQFVWTTLSRVRAARLPLRLNE